MGNQYPFKRFADENGLRYEFDHRITRVQHDLILSLLRGDYKLSRTPQSGRTTSSDLVVIEVTSWYPHGGPLARTVLEQMDEHVAGILEGRMVEPTVLLDPQKDHPTLLQYAIGYRP